MGSKSGKPGPDPGEGGREPLLTPALLQAIIDNRELLGMPEGLCGEAEGIDDTTVSKWKTRGRLAAENWDNLSAKQRAREVIYRNFFTALRAARPKFIKANCTVMQNAALTDWRAAARRLEWEDPLHFGRATKLLGDPKHPLPVVPRSTVLILPDNRRGDGPKAKSEPTKQKPA